MRAMAAVDAIAWLEAFAARVRARDIDGGRALFSDACHSFGTRGEVLDGLDDLVERQWRPTWMTTQGFTFESSTIRVELAADGSLAVATACWASDGLHPDGTTFPRRGRATLVLARREDGAPIAVHSHFSESPE